MSNEGFNTVFGEDDACDLIANGLAIKPYRCGWTTNGQPCNTVVLGMDFSNHLKSIHHVNDQQRVDCQWGTSCGDNLGRVGLVRHVQEKHLEWRWPCPRCRSIFTRRGVMESHRSQCNGNSG